MHTQLQSWTVAGLNREVPQRTWAMLPVGCEGGETWPALAKTTFQRVCLGARVVVSVQQWPCSPPMMALRVISCH